MDRHRYPGNIHRGIVLGAVEMNTNRGTPSQDNKLYIISIGFIFLVNGAHLIQQPPL